ncbi:MAG TPA: methionyl-tRNA formyltransferase [Firmicutes bacterium]|nr:methionyl-tRNA formyltransferase [Bacillota bacterium]
MKDIRAVFMGTPEFAVSILDKLVELVDVVLVVSQPDAIIGRKKVLEESAVTKRASELGIEVVKPTKIREDYEKIIEVKPDIIVTCAYGQIIPKILLDTPRLGCINVHASLLPKYRGGAPIQRAIMEGEKETGITVMYMDEHMDSGDIIEKRSIPILESDNCDSLSGKLASLGADLLGEVLPKVIDGTSKRVSQDESKVTYGYIIKREDELLNFNDSTLKVFNKIRGLSTKPGAYFILNGRIIKVLESRIGSSHGDTNHVTEIYKDGFGIATLDGEIVITKVKPEGKKEMSARDFLNGINKDELKGMELNV